MKESVTEPDESDVFEAELIKTIREKRDAADQLIRESEPFILQEDPFTSVPCWFDGKEIIFFTNHPYPFFMLKSIVRIYGSQEEANKQVLIVHYGLPETLITMSLDKVIRACKQKAFL